MFEPEVYVNRRKKLKEQVKTGKILLLGNEESSMSYRDNLYPFRQDSTFLYFTGLDLPGLAFLIDIDNDTECLIGEDLTVDDIIWTGPQPSLSALADRAGITMVIRHKQLRTASKNNSLVHFLPPYRPEHILKLSAWLKTGTSTLGNKASVALIEAVVAMRSIKSGAEIAEIEQAVATTTQMQLFAMQTARAGLTEASLAGPLQGLSIAAGGNLSFKTILTTHGEVLHNHYSNNVLPKDAMVLLDCGAETGMHYAGDLTRTFPVNNSFSQQQAEMYTVVLSALQSAGAALQPGKQFKDVHLLACAKLTEGLQQLGLMQGNIEESVEAGAHTLFFQCGLGHMMGLDVHDMENLGEQYVGYDNTVKKSTAFGLKSLRLGKALESGFVVTVEPGLYFIPQLIDLWQKQKKNSAFINYDKLNAYRSFGGIRIEDDFVITDSGSRLLSESLPRLIKDVEEVRRSLNG